MDLFWVGIDQNWHDANNWSLTSGGVGGAGIPTALDDVYFDGNGNTLCYPTSDIVCNNLSLLTGTLVNLLIDASAVIHGDFLLGAGYFAPTGGPDHTVEFKGNWLNTGGSFSVGTGTGRDPECIFSGMDKTYQLNQTSSASFQHVTVSGTLTVSGTRLGQMNIAQEISITGILTVNANGLTVCDIDLAGPNSGFGVFTGELAGTGRFWWRFRECHTIPNTGTISIKYFRLRIEEPGTGSITENLDVDSWTLVNSDFIHTGTDPWLHDDDTSNYISSSAVNDIDEEYGIANLVGDYTALTPSNVRVHLKGKISGPCTLAAINVSVWDGTAWIAAGSCLFNSGTYTDNDGSNISGFIDTMAKVQGMKLKLEVALLLNGGSVDITHAYIEVDGTATWNPIVTVAPRTYEAGCEVEFEYTDPESTFRLDAGNHYFLGKVTIRGEDAVIDAATFDCKTNQAQMWVGNKFDVYKDAFPSATFNLLFGDGTHVFRGSIDFYFSYSSASTHLVVDPGNGTIILWPKGRQVIPLR